MRAPPTVLDGRSNILLRHLSVEDRAVLAPHAIEQQVKNGSSVLSAEGPIDAVYFPEATTISIEEPLGDARSVQIAMVGREGMVGWAALLGSRSSSHSAFVRASGGAVVRIEIEPLRAACRSSPPLHEALLRFVHIMMLQMARSIASHLQHPLNQRLARWLLMRHDRLSGDVLFCHHDEIAQCLSVRRASITDQLHLIEGERLIRCTRGQLLVRDRIGLELYAGEAYGHTEEHYRKMIAPFGRISL